MTNEDDNHGWRKGYACKPKLGLLLKAAEDFNIELS